MPLDVICRGCGGKFHETNDSNGWIKTMDGTGQVQDPRVRAFDPARAVNASMFRLKDFYARQAWADFPKDPAYTGDTIECPACGTPYPDQNGRVLTAKQTPEKKTKKKK